MTIDVSGRRLGPLFVKSKHLMLTFLKLKINIFIYCLIFFSQAIACYTPKFLWDAFEGGLLRMIVMGLNLGICREEEKQAKKEVILSYLTTHLKVSKFFIHYNYFLFILPCNATTKTIEKRQKITMKLKNTLDIEHWARKKANQANRKNHQVEWHFLHAANRGYIINPNSCSIAYFLCRRWQVRKFRLFCTQHNAVRENIYIFYMQKI